MNECIYLIPALPAPDDTYGDTQQTPDTVKKRMVFGDAKSVSRSEYYKAKELGIELKAVLVVNLDDYNDERFAEYNGATYRIEREYRKEQKLELVCETIGAPAEAGG